MKNKIVRWWNSEQGINLTAHIIFFTPVFFMLWGVFYCLLWLLFSERVRPVMHSVMLYTAGALVMCAVFILPLVMYGAAIFFGL